jgi:hypothetical protein
MTFGGEDTAREAGLAKAITTLAEAIGLFNKGSATAAAAPTQGTSGEVEPISSNTLNVTRVGGIASLISGAGAAAIGIFSINGSDHDAVRAAAYGAVGLIVAAALVTVAVIIAADVRARGAIAVAASAAPRPPAVKSIDAHTTTQVTLDAMYDHVLVKADEGTVEMTLPDATQNEWQSLTINRTDGTAEHRVVVAPVAGVADGNVYLKPKTAVTLYAEGGAWFKL